MPRRWKNWPPAIFDIFADVDLILHAGDVGELWVLDQLSAIAPVIAVHGNDESADAQRELPYQQLITIGGKRILLWHSHYQDRIDEMASRHYQEWGPKLDRIADRGKRANADIVVFGHFHVPLIYEQKGVTLVNPGALASGNALVRQSIQTVAKLTIGPDVIHNVAHVDLAHPEQLFESPADLSGGVAEVLRLFSVPIVESSIIRQSSALWEQVLPLAPQPIERAFLRLAHRRWSRETDTLISWGDLIEAMRVEAGVSAETRSQIIATLQQLAAQ
jgi:putative phosphoesterase